MVREFASDDATVVIGTVIDPEINDELRVTVVATGIGNAPVQESMKVVDNARPKTTRADGTLNLQELDIPSAVRNKVPGSRSAATGW